MSHCQDKARLMKTLKKECDLLKEELKISQNKVESLEKDHITLVNKICDKNLSEHDIALRDFIITNLERTKLASMIYGVSKSKGKGLGYNEKCSNSKAQLIKTSRASSLSSTQTVLKTCFVSASDKGKSQNKSEAKINESNVLNKSIPKVSKSKVVKKSEPNIQKSKVLKNPEPKNSKSKVIKKVESKIYGSKVLKGSNVKTYPR